MTLSYLTDAFGDVKRQAPTWPSQSHGQERRRSGAVPGRRSEAGSTSGSGVCDSIAIVVSPVSSSGRLFQQRVTPV